jgi:hypothetical protein
VRRALLIATGVVILAAGLAGGFGLAEIAEETTTVTETTTDTLTTTATTETVAGIPPAVETTRAELLAAAESGDYEALRPLVPESGFEYTFGGPVEGGPVAYWQELERTTDERPLEALAAILKMPYALSRGFYYWPWAHTVGRAVDLSPHERELLAPLGAPTELFPEGSGYFGWRTAISPDGKWVFFVAGD